MVKVKVNFSLEQAVKVQRYSSTLSLTSALDGSGLLTLLPVRFTPGEETRYPLYRRADGPQGQSGRVRKILPPPGLDSRTVRPTAFNKQGINK